MKYDVYNIPDPKHPGEQIQHLRPISWGVLTHEELVHMMCSHGSSLDRGTVAACLTKLSNVLCEAMANGKRPQINGIGTFSMQLKKKEASEVEDLNKIRSNGVEVKTVSFLPSDDFLYELDRQCYFEKSDMTNRSDDKSLSELKDLLKDYFTNHQFLTRYDFQYLACLTRSTATRRLKKLVAINFIKNIGEKGYPMYVLVDSTSETEV